MSVEFFGSCDPRFVPTPGALVDELMVRGIILRAYGPFPGSGAHTVLCFAEGGVRGFSLRIEEERVPVELLFRQNILPSLAEANPAAFGDPGAESDTAPDRSERLVGRTRLPLP